jgi:hypothetical protein
MRTAGSVPRQNFWGGAFGPKRPQTNAALKPMASGFGVLANAYDRLRGIAPWDQADPQRRHGDGPPHRQHGKRRGKAPTPKPPLPPTAHAL